jgi:hypothetical protein
MVRLGPVTVVGFLAGIGAVADLAAVCDRAGAGWLVLDPDGVISRWDLAETGCTAVARTSVAESRNVHALPRAEAIMRQDGTQRATWSRNPKADPYDTRP